MSTLTPNVSSSSSSSAQTPPPSYGGMNQVGSGPAGMLYSLSNQLIGIYNDLQTLYNKVAIAETNVQQVTILAGASAQRDNAKQQSIGIYLQAGEAIVGAVGSLVPVALEVKGYGPIDEKITGLENELTPLKELDGLKKGDLPAARVVGDPIEQNINTNVGPRATELKNGQYEYTGDLTTEGLKELNQRAINSMNPKQFKKFKAALHEEIMNKERNLNTQQTQRQSLQTRYNSYGQIFSQGANTPLKGFEAQASAAAGNAQADQQIAQGVQQMANSTADSAKGSMGQDYAKISDVIAAARQGAQSYAQT